MPKQSKWKGGRAQAGSLLNLATARTGVQVPFDCVQIVDKQTFSEVTDSMFRHLSRIATQAEGRIEAEKLRNALTETAYRQDDGSLHVYFDSVYAPAIMRSIPAGHWRQLSEDDLIALEQESIRQMTETPEGADLFGMLVDRARQTNAELKEREQITRRQLSNCTQVVTIVDRNPVGLEVLPQILSGRHVLISRVDEWLAGGDEYAFISLGPDPSSNWVITSADLDVATSKTLQEITEYLEDLSTVALGVGRLPARVSKRFCDAWQSMGGLVLGMEGPAVDPESPTLQEQRDNVRELDGLMLIVDRTEEGRNAVSDLARQITQELKLACNKALEEFAASSAKFLVINFYSNDGVEQLATQAGDVHDLTAVLRQILLSSTKGGGTIGTFSIAVDDEMRRAVEFATREAGKSLAGLAAAAAMNKTTREWKTPAINGLSCHVASIPGKQLTIVDLDREKIERGETKPLVDLMREMVQDPGVAMDACQSLMITVSGYDADHRAVHDIPEVRAFCASVSAQCPWWLHVISHHSMCELNTLSWWPLCMAELLSPTEYEASGLMRMHVDVESMKEVMLTSFRACSDLYQRLLREGGEERMFASAIKRIGDAMTSTFEAGA